jgi:hypothetical protein
VESHLLADLVQRCLEQPGAKLDLAANLELPLFEQLAHGRLHDVESVLAPPQLLAEPQVHETLQSGQVGAQQIRDRSRVTSARRQDH